MRRDDLPPSRQKGSMVGMPAQCGKHVIYYPGILAQMAMQEAKYHVFHTSCECGRAYIITTQDNGAHTRIEGGMLEAAELYEAIPWGEFQYVDRNGVFFYKQAPSLDRLKGYFDEVAALDG